MTECILGVDRLSLSINSTHQFGDDITAIKYIPECSQVVIFLGQENMEMEWKKKKEEYDS